MGFAIIIHFNEYFSERLVPDIIEQHLTITQFRKELTLGYNIATPNVFGRFTDFEFEFFAHTGISSTL